MTYSRAFLASLLLVICSVGCGAAVPACTRGVVTRSCSDSRSVETVRVTDPGVWTAIDVGPDRIYIPHSGFPTEDVERWLRAERDVLRRLSGVSPTPIGVVLGIGEKNVDVLPDAAGRAVWPIVTSSDGALLVAHEWTHGILAKLKRSDDRSERFLEDGFCDLVATATCLEVRSCSSEIISSDIAALRERVATVPPRVNLLRLAERYDETRHSMKELCADTPSWAYALGLALWLGGGVDPRDVAVRGFAAFRASPRSTFEDVAAPDVVGQLHARDLDVRLALAILERAAGVDGGERSPTPGKSAPR